MESTGDRRKDFQLIHEVAEAVSEAPSLESALLGTIELVCKRTEWRYGEVWLPNEDGDKLVPSKAWYGRGKGIDGFRAATENLSFDKGVGLPGRVWEARDIEWVKDVSSDTTDLSLRRSAASAANFHAAIAVPIIANDDVVAVLSFFLGEPKESDTRHVALVSTIAILGGLFLRKRQLEVVKEEREAYKRRFESHPVGVLVFEPDGTIIDANPQASDVLQLDIDELLGTKLSQTPLKMFDWDGDPIPPHETPITEVVATGKSIQGRQLGVHTPGDDRWLLVNAAPVTNRDGNVEQVIVVVEDRTSKYTWEREIERQNERLTRFASVVSHDLRTPLSTAATALQLAKQDCESEHLDTAERAMGRMDVIIDDVLTLAKEGKRVIQTEQVPLATVAGNAWENVAAPKATLETIGKPTIVGDPDRLERMLENLFRNAVEHGDDDVTVRVGNLEPNGFYVEDDGPGIPENERERVFETGYTTRESGAGFGLSIVREIAYAHDWDIEVMAGESGGARFEIRPAKAT
ncbi:ATP-binding protein [Haloarchaeobius sp. DFWS5]|uniref:sensor histidine kinase n=1 Tax=Haloarchaeobius sp. DFWS5 TaxID=3446114 RepID=UPI003EB98949